MWAKSWSCRVAPNKLVPFSLQTNPYFYLKHHWKWLRQAFKWLEVILDSICKCPPACNRLHCHVVSALFKEYQNGGQPKQTKIPPRPNEESSYTFYSSFSNIVSFLVENLSWRNIEIQLIILQTLKVKTFDQSQTKLQTDEWNTWNTFELWIHWF